MVPAGGSGSLDKAHPIELMPGVGLLERGGDEGQAVGESVKQGKRRTFEAGSGLGGGEPAAGVARGGRHLRSPRYATNMCVQLDSISGGVVDVDYTLDVLLYTVAVRRYYELVRLPLGSSTRR